MLQANRLPQRTRHIVTLPTITAYETTNLSQYTVLTSDLSLANAETLWLFCTVALPSLNISPSLLKLRELPGFRGFPVFSQWLLCHSWRKNLCDVSIDHWKKRNCWNYFSSEDAGSWMHYPCKLCIFLEQYPRRPTSLKRMVLKSSYHVFCYRFARFLL